MKAGIIGLGKMGISHCSILGSHDDIKEISICDSSKFLLSAFKQHSKFKCYTDYKRMIKDNKLDFVVVATPTKFHYDMVKYALENNCHVFCEKPFVLSTYEGSELNNIAVENNLVNQVGYHNRFIGTFQATKKYVDFGLIGDIYHIKGAAYGPVVVKEKTETWRSDPAEGGGCLYDYASHVINLMQYIVGATDRVSGTILKNIYSKNVEDAVYSSIFYKNGITGQLSVNWSEETYRKMTTKIEVYGKKGKIVSDAQECQLYLKEEPIEKGFCKGWNSFWITDQTQPVWFNLRGEEYSAQLDYFINCIKKDSVENINSFEQSLQTDTVIEMLRQDAGNIL